MKWLEAKVFFELAHTVIVVDLIAEIFYKLGLQGVVIEDPHPELEEGCNSKALNLPKHHSITGYFPIDGQIRKRCTILEEHLIQLKETVGIQYRISYSQIEEKDWAESWKAYFRPEKISHRIIIKPTWREYRPNPQEMIIELDPGMAFGTGTHPTTRMCVNLIETYLKKGQSFLDIGTGSGVLLIAAAKLGAEKGLGIDNDKVAVDIAQKNLRLNHIDHKMFRVINGDLLKQVNETYHLVNANISSEVILTLSSIVQRVLKKNGVFICSGFLEEDQDAIKNKLLGKGLEILKVLKKKNWVAIASRTQNT